MYVPSPVVVTVAPPVPPKRSGPALLALKYAPGVSAGWDWDSHSGTVGFAQTVGLELRPWGWLALRSDFEWRREGRSWDMLGLKVWVFPPSWFIRPYVSASASGTELYAARGRYQLGMVAAAGVDVYFGRHFFLDAEVRFRVSPGQADWRPEASNFSALIGGGVAFF